MPLYLKDGKLLLSHDGQLALDEKCCCDKCCTARIACNPWLSMKGRSGNGGEGSDTWETYPVNGTGGRIAAGAAGQGGVGMTLTRGLDGFVPGAHYVDGCDRVHPLDAITAWQQYSATLLWGTASCQLKIRHTTKWWTANYGYGRGYYSCVMQYIGKTVPDSQCVPQSIKSWEIQRNITGNGNCPCDAVGADYVPCMCETVQTLNRDFQLLTGSCNPLP